MRSPAIFSVSVALLLVGCTSSRAQEPKPKEYVYEYPCSTWQEPARIITNRPVGRADTTLALLSGQIVNFNKSEYGETYPTYIIAEENAAAKKIVALTDKTGAYRLYVPSGTYRVKFSSMGFSPLVIDTLELHSGQRQQLDLFLHVALSSSGTGTCLYKSKRKLSVAELDTILARADASRTRLYQKQTKAEASVGAKK